MKREPQQNTSAGIAQPTEENACCDGRKGFGGWFTEVDHAVGDGHHKDRIKSDARTQTLDHKTAEEEINAEKLGKIQ